MLRKLCFLAILQLVNVHADDDMIYQKSRSGVRSSCYAHFDEAVTEFKERRMRKFRLGSQVQRKLSSLSCKNKLVGQVSTVPTSLVIQENVNKQFKLKSDKQHNDANVEAVDLFHEARKPPFLEQTVQLHPVQHITQNSD